MNPFGQFGQTARHLVALGARAAGTATGTATTALDALGRCARAATRPATVRGVAVEAGWMAVHLVLYPWGALTDETRPDSAYDCYRTDDLPPTRRGLLIADVRAAGTPILLVHGMVDNRSVFAVLSRALRKRGFGAVYGLNYSVLTAVTGDVRTAARELGHEVERICEATGAEQVHVVGHSLGGLIARYYVQRLGGDERIHTLVTLGTPHHGTQLARLLPTPVVRQLRPGSDVLAELAEPSPGCRTRFVAVWSDLDQLIVPPQNARLDHPDLLVTNHRLRDVGHLTLSADSRTVHMVASTLATLDQMPPATADPFAAEATVPRVRARRRTATTADRSPHSAS